MKKIIVLFLILIPFLGTSQSKSADILGVWLTEIEDGKVEVFQKGDKFYGRIVWIAEPFDEDGNPLLDENNPNESLRKKPLMKLITLNGFTFDDGEYVDGTVYDPKNGETYECKMWIEDGDLKVRGYIGWLFDTKTWSRVK